MTKFYFSMTRSSGATYPSLECFTAVLANAYFTFSSRLMRKGTFARTIFLLAAFSDEFLSTSRTNTNVFDISRLIIAESRTKHSTRMVNISEFFTALEAILCSHLKFSFSNLHCIGGGQAREGLAGHAGNYSASVHNFIIPQAALNG